MCFAWLRFAVRLNRSREAGFTLLEVLIVVAIIGVLALIAGNRIMRAKMSAEDASAVAALRNINSAQASFSASCANGHYATDLADLSLPPSGSRAGFISPDLSSNGVQKGGYTFTVARGGDADTTDSPTAACNGGAVPASSYYASADRVGFAGARYFATDKRGAVYEGMNGPLPNPIPSTAALLK
jgi:prepilin-type N-terminal cleavage/methylation domain-containing protein